MTPIWRFATAGGLVRILLEVDRASAEDLYLELAGCAIVAEDLTEFMSLAHHAADRSGAIIGELLKQPWPDRSFREGMSAAFKHPKTLGAAEAVLAAAGSATIQDVNDLMTSPGWEVERSFLLGVFYGLDDIAQPFLLRLASTLSVDPAALARAVGVIVDD